MIESDKKYKVWSICTILGIIAALLALAGITYYVDPYFHFHGETAGISYPLSKERYQNDGIVRHFKYDSIIAGSSMCENFKTSEFDELFDCDSIKVAFYGGCYREVNENLQKAFESGNKIKYVVRSIDYTGLIRDKDYLRNDTVYPTYLTDDNPLNDVKYLFNKETFISDTIGTLKYTKRGYKTTSFDEYGNWSNEYSYGKEAVLKTYELNETAAESYDTRKLTVGERKILIENIEKNYITLIKQHPDTTFYLFFTPYSICYWDGLNNSGEIQHRIDMEQLAIEELLQCSNIKLFAFSNWFDMVCDLDNFKDRAHFGEWINSQILICMSNEQYMITADNYMEYIDEITKFYSTYDYKSLHE